MSASLDSFRTSGVALFMLLVWTASDATGGQGQSTTARERERFLNTLISQGSTIQGAELARAIRDGLADSEPRMRIVALSALAARAGGPRFVDTETVRSRWRADRVALTELRPYAFRALGDPDTGVRHAAILAIGNLDFDLDRASEALATDTIQAFSTHFRTEPDPASRTEIVKGLALSSNDGPDIRAVLAAALSDSSSPVIQYAALGAAKRRDESLLPRVMELITSDDPTLRLAIAKAIGDYGAIARSHLPALHDALSRETEPLTRNQLNRVIAALEGSR